MVKTSNPLILKQSFFPILLFNYSGQTTIEVNPERMAEPGIISAQWLAQLSCVLFHFERKKNF